MTLVALVVVALAEVLGDLAMRLGLGGRTWGFALYTESRRSR